MKTNITLALLILICNVQIYGQIVINPTFYSTNDSLPAIGVVIKFEDSKKIKVSNDLGKVTKNIKSLPIQIQVRSKFYIDTLILINSVDEVIYLKNKEIALAEIAILKAEVENYTGSIRLTKKDINRLPFIGGEKDIFKSIQYLTGVTNVMEGSSGLNVRGGKIDQNNVLLNNVPLLGISSMFGFLAPINPQIVKSFEFYKGIIPSNLGGKASSVIDIKSNPINLSELDLEAELGILSSKIYLNTPIIENKLGLQLSIRRNFFSTIRSLENILDVKNLPNYWMNDFYGEFGWQISKNLKLQSFMFKNKENWTVEDDTRVSNLIYNKKPTNKLVGMNINHFVNSSFFYDLTFSQSRYKLEIENSLNQLFFSEKYLFLNLLKLNLFKYNSTLTFSEKSSMKLGIEYRDFFNAPTSNSYFKNDTSIFNLSNSNGIKVYVLNSLFQQHFSKKLSFVLSNRLNFTKGKAFFEPNVNFLYKIKESQFGFGLQRLSQFEQILTNPGLGPSEDIWIIPDNILQKKLQVNACFLNYKNQIELRQSSVSLSMDFYIKEYSNSINWNDGFSSTNFTIFQNNIVSKIIYESFDYGRVLAKGFELGIDYHYSKYDFKVGFSRLSSIEKYTNLNLGNAFHSSFEQTNKLNLQYFYRLNHFFDFSLNWAFSTGRPITIPIGVINFPIDLISVYPTENNTKTSQPYFVFSNRNEYRMKNYHSLDINFNRKVKYKFADGNWTFSINNLYNRKNASYYTSSFNQQTKSFSLNSITLFPLIVSISTSISIR